LLRCGACFLAFIALVGRLVDFVGAGQVGFQAVRLDVRLWALGAHVLFVARVQILVDPQRTHPVEAFAAVEVLTEVGTLS
jgi:hypothetical protein